MDDLIKIKADIICHGLLVTKVAEEIYKYQNPNEMHKQGRYFGVMIKLEGKVSLLANVSYDNKNANYKLEGTLKDLELRDKNNIFICKASFINPPKWYEKTTKTNKKATEIFIDEGENYLHMTYTGCDYYKCNLKCKFCGCKERLNDSTANEIAEVVDYAKNERNYHVCLGGGAYLPLQKSTEKFLEIISKIREKSKDIPIWVEMVPPTNKEIEMLVLKGATSFGFNIEVYDEKLRKEICPGKSSISIEEYIKRSKFANSLLGGNKVGSTLICGIAPNETIKKGIDELTDNKIHPCILAFRPSQGSEYENKTECDTESFYECSKYAVLKMLEKDLDIFQNEGCLLCEYCTILHDLTREIFDNKNSSINNIGESL